PRNRLPATAAARAQQEKTEDGNVVEPSDGCAARGAMASRKDDRLFARIAIDHDVEEAANNRAEGKGIEGQESQHLQLIVRCGRSSKFEVRSSNEELRNG